MEVTRYVRQRVVTVSPVKEGNGSVQQILELAQEKRIEFALVDLSLTLNPNSRVRSHGKIVPFCELRNNSKQEEITLNGFGVLNMARNLDIRLHVHLSPSCTAPVPPLLRVCPVAEAWIKLDRKNDESWVHVRWECDRDSIIALDLRNGISAAINRADGIMDPQPRVLWFLGATKSMDGTLHDFVGEQSGDLLLMNNNALHLDEVFLPTFAWARLTELKPAD